jgi:hypothetical protein
MPDLNSKSKSIGCSQDNSNGSTLEKIISNNDCIVLENNEHTYFNFRKDKIFSDKLDLAICSSALFNKLENLVVFKNDDMTSDHVPIQIEINTDKNEAETSSEAELSSKGFNYNKANWNLFREYLPCSAPSDILNDVNKLNDFIINNLLKAAES